MSDFWNEHTDDDDDDDENDAYEASFSNYGERLWSNSLFASMFPTLTTRRRNTAVQEPAPDEDMLERIEHEAAQLLEAKKHQRLRDERARRDLMVHEFTNTLVAIRELPMTPGVKWQRQKDGSHIAVVS